jgi:hypothetical protein
MVAGVTAMSIPVSLFLLEGDAFGLSVVKSVQIGCVSFCEDAVRWGLACRVILVVAASAVTTGMIRGAPCTSEHFAGLVTNS